MSPACHGPGVSKQAVYKKHARRLNPKFSGKTRRCTDDFQAFHQVRRRCVKVVVGEHILLEILRDEPDRTVRLPGNLGVSTAAANSRLGQLRRQHRRADR